MWTYYTAVVLVGIGFLTIGLLWTLAALGAGLGLFFGYRNRDAVIAKLRQSPEDIGKFLRQTFRRAPAARARTVEQADRRWLFPETRMQDIRKEGFEALSESFLLLKRLAPYHSAALFEYDTDTRLAYPRIYSTSSDTFRRDALVSVSDGVVGYCLSSGKTVHYADFKGDARLLGYYTGSEEIRSVLVVPLDRAQRRLGALALDAKSPDAFAARMEEITHLANVLAELLVRVQREETLLMRLEEDRTLKAMTERMAKAGVSIEDVADSLCKLAKEVFPADRVTFVVFDDPASTPLGSVAAAGGSVTDSSIVRFRSLKMLDRYVELVSRTQKAIRLDDLWENGLMSLATGQTGLTTRSILAAPFVFESHVVGVVLVEADRRRAFTTFHETAIGELVQHAATAVARAIEYGRMEKTCAIADVVPAAADCIFSEPTLAPVLDLLKSRFGVAGKVYEVVAAKTGEVRLRPWEDPESEPVDTSLFQKNAIETRSALLRTDGKVSPAKEASGEIPAGSDLVFPLSAGQNAQWPLGLLCVSVKSPLRPESVLILDRIRSLIQIRLVLERRERQFGFLKVRDPLTGVYHTASFEKKLEDRIRRAKPTGERFHFLLVQPGRMPAVKRTHGFAEFARRYASLCSEIERLCGPHATVGRVGPDHVGVIWEEGAEALRPVRQQIEKLSEPLGFEVQTGVSEFPSADGVWALIETAAQASLPAPAEASTA
ncbi:MAG: hypothetical protein A3G34_11995 [Candidatus Lindowbacteria bacterium RIFCSPLOWO2_12_FULL_62_27]|nr:MAG: hypothetical protein A3I06_07260 [Candidatus Lindowbacteria bacterium RIFCSPLOWO2_02_FULL_62_12]OGH61095.1 MAG: hypothetical protein A3G34_11995 [Candidatus Lindowbacteria bacterium RIFCSPLOWO2_12_FULL_62_27]